MSSQGTTKMSKPNGTEIEVKLRDVGNFIVFYKGKANLGSKTEVRQLMKDLDDKGVSFKKMRPDWFD